MVWADKVDNVVPAARILEEALVAFLWAKETAPALGSKSELDLQLGASTLSLDQPTAESPTAEVCVDTEDPEKAKALEARKARPVALISAVISGCAAALALCLMGLGLQTLVIQFFYDQQYIHLALAATLPFLLFMAAFPCSVIVTSIFSIFGPIAHYDRNSVFYSAVPPLRTGSSKLLPITVQMPVYKEDLVEVIQPTIESLKKAVTTFERQGGSVNVIVCDDGLQLISPDEREQRLRYYKNNNVAYVARPPHGKDGFLRRGRFKKAGNLNYTNRLSLRIEDLMKEMKPDQMEEMGVTEEEWSEADETVLYHLALVKAVEEDEGRTWAEGNIRM